MRTLWGFAIIGMLIGALPSPINYLALFAVLLPLSIVLYTSSKTLIQRHPRRKDTYTYVR